MTNQSIELYQDDCTTLLKSLTADSIDLIIADIPYGEVSNKMKGAKPSSLRNLNKSNADVLKFNLGEVLDQSLRVCRGSFYIFCGFGQVSQIYKFYEDHKCSVRFGVLEKTNPPVLNGSNLWLSGLEAIVYAKKPGATFNEHCKAPIFKAPVQRNNLHPTQKDIHVIERMIEASSNPGDTVLDFCMGSGTTGVAAKSLCRNFIGCELHPPYFEIAKKRIDSTFSKPRLIPNTQPLKRSQPMTKPDSQALLSF